MSSLPTVHRATLAAPLCDDEIRLVLLPYQRTQRRAPLRELLAIHLDTSAAQLQITEDSHGKPRLCGPHRALQFNWSHSGDRALIALARGIEPGVDLERCRPRPRALDIAERYFTPTERAQIERACENERTAVFLRLWTAKEALLKALGRGLAFGLDRLCVQIDERGELQLTLFETQHSPDWQLHSVAVDDGEYTAALAWRGSARQLQVMQWAG